MVFVLPAVPKEDEDVAFSSHTQSAASDLEIILPQHTHTHKRAQT